MVISALGIVDVDYFKLYTHHWRCLSSSEAQRFFAPPILKDDIEGGSFELKKVKFAAKKPGTPPHGTWKVLIVDDDPGIHTITRTVLRDLVYENRSLDFLSAYSRQEALQIFKGHDDIALVLLDVVMEDDDSGLRLVEDIRELLNNKLVRIVLRTGQPGRAPSQRVIVEYDINDYEEKTDLTAQKLFTTVIASLRNYRDLEILDRTRTNLEKHRLGLVRIIEATAAMFGTRTPREFSLVCYKYLKDLVDPQDSDLSSFVALQDESFFSVIAGKGDFKNSIDSDPRDIIGDNMMNTLRVLKREERNLLIQDGSVYLYEDARNVRLLIYISGAERYDTVERQILDTFASSISMAFENLRLNREIVDTQEELMIRLGEVIETRSHDTAQHVRRVGEFSAHLARLIGFNNKDIYNLKMAGSLHDIGKIGIPDDILLKPDLLNKEEFSIIRRHTEIGYEMLKESTKPVLQIASLICLQHHERFDGNGYPYGLKGINIHIYSRIVAICDVFDSLTHGRLHREPWNLDRAVEYMKEQRGKAFDPEILDFFLDDIDEIARILDKFPD